MPAKNFLFLISASAADRPALQKIQANIVRSIDSNAKPLWFDTTHAGFFICTDLVARLVWERAFHGLAPRDTENLRDLLVLEMGEDFAARSGAKTTAWLQSHGLKPKLA